MKKYNPILTCTVFLTGCSFLFQTTPSFNVTTSPHDRNTFDIAVIQNSFDPGHAYLDSEWYIAKAVLESKKRNCTHFKKINSYVPDRPYGKVGIQRVTIKCISSPKKKNVNYESVADKEFQYRNTINKISNNSK